MDVGDGALLAAQIGGPALAALWGAIRAGKAERDHMKETQSRHTRLLDKIEDRVRQLEINQGATAWDTRNTPNAGA